MTRDEFLEGLTPAARSFWTGDAFREAAAGEAAPSPEELRQIRALRAACRRERALAPKRRTAAAAIGAPVAPSCGGPDG